MLNSMTAFSNESYQDEYGILTWECKSINHRYLDVSLRLPEMFRQQEPLLRDLINKTIKRGKVEMNLKYQTGNQVPYEFVLNAGVAERLAGVVAQLTQRFPTLRSNATDLLNWQGLLQVKETHTEQLQNAMMTLFHRALNHLVLARQREGMHLYDFFHQRIVLMRQQITRISQRMTTVLSLQREKVMTRFTEMQLSLDAQRLEQEIVWLAQKMDVAEEIERLTSHVTEVARLLDSEEVVGRRLDFFMQELHREANTLGNKSVDAEMSQVVIELKVLIEQMREQVQNIE